MKTALITGASRGLGKALALKFINASDFSAILHCFKTEVHSCLATVIRGDLVLPDTIEKLAQHDVDILINNAGIHFSKPLNELSPDEVREVINTNLTAPMLLTKAMWPTLSKNKGMVININSLAGKQGSQGETAYCASKFGLRGFSQALQFDATQAGVKVLDVFIGGMQTDMAKSKPNFDKLIDP